MQNVNRKRAPEDGLGWLVNYICKLVANYPSFTRKFVLDDLPMIEGWVWVAYAEENNAMNQLNGVTAKSRGYVGMETDKLKKQAVDFWEKQK